MTPFATLTIAAAALIDPIAARPASDAAPATAPAASPMAASQADQRYCVVDTITGSRIPIKQCHTLAEWQQRGVDTDGWTRR